MRRAVALHCEVSGRPYRIDDFRKPLKDLGVIQQVSGIGAYQMSHVWLLHMKTEQAKKALTDASVLKVKDRKQTTSDDTPVLNKSKQVSSALDTNAGRKMGGPVAPTTSEQTRPAPAMHAASQLQATRPETTASQANADSTPLNSALQHSLANETHENEDLPGDLDTLRAKPLKRENARDSDERRCERRNRAFARHVLVFARSLGSPDLETVAHRPEVLG
ncbi:hypothetical protein HPB51_005730 [Rhipicephalus microplus]|uniref:Uncharacterized protein n=1 Tax=Rhipicephalus microplus TaxID=6941 RepID=A0A9J6EYJ7_RHIMP|nr:hypothetical protein HPB51_005730 [Rhipicephalus microplus]